MRQLYIPAFALLVIGYPLTAVLFLEIGWPGGAVATKGLIAFLFGLSLIGSIDQRRTFPIDFVPLYAFYALYGFRLLDDVLNKGIVPPGATAPYILLYFFGLTFLPGLAIGLAFKREDVPLLHRWLFWMLVLTNVAVIYYSFAIGGLQSETAFSGRFEVEGVIAGTAVLSPIIVSMTGAVLCLFVIGRFAAFGKMSLSVQFLHVGLFLLGMGNLLIGGSRGPMIDFGVAIVFVMASIAMSMMGRGHLRLTPRIIVYLALATAGFVVLALTSADTITVFDRLKTMFSLASGRTVEARDYIFAAAWRDFTNSPVIGHSYLTMNGQVIAHNSLLEALMAVGFFGGLAYIFSFWMFLRGVWSSLLGYVTPHAYSIALIAVAFMALSMTSGSVGQAPEVWGLMSLMMCMSSVGDRPPGRQDDDVEQRP